MKVLLVCSLGMSSDISVNALKKEAEKQGQDMEVHAVSSGEFKDEVTNGYDVAMVAPQIRHRFRDLKAEAEEAHVLIDLIEPMAYSPLGGPKLYKQVMTLYNNSH